MENIPTKSAGDKYFSAEFNQSNDEIKNSVEDTGQVLSGSDPRQISKAMVNYAGSGDFYASSGPADAYILTAIGNKQSPTALTDGLRARFIPNNSNTGASTVNVATLGVKDIKKYDGINDLEANDLLAGRQAEIIYISSSDEWELTSIESPIVTESIPLFMSVSGMALSTNTVAPLTDIDIAGGSWKDTNSANAFTHASVLVKQLDNVWVAGTNAGGRASAVTYVLNKWYHVFAIGKPDGTVDAGFDDDISATNLLADATGYTFFRRIGSIKTEQASTDIIPFYNKISIYSGQREFYWVGEPTGSIFTVTDPPNLTPTNFTVLTPIDLELKSVMTCSFNQVAGPGDGDVDLSIISPLRAPTFAIRAFVLHDSGPGETSSQVNDFFTYTNSSSELIYELLRGGTATGVQVVIRTNGWIE